MADIWGAVGGAGRGASAGSAFGAPGAVVGGVIGGLAGAFGGSDDEARDLAREQNRVARLFQAENRRRALNEQAQILGESRARIAASNLLDTGSSRRFRRNVSSELRRQLAWEDMSSYIEQEMRMNEAGMIDDQLRASSISDAIGGITSAVSTFGPDIMSAYQRSKIKPVTVTGTRKTGSVLG